MTSFGSRFNSCVCQLLMERAAYVLPRNRIKVSPCPISLKSSQQLSLKRIIDRQTEIEFIIVI